MVLRTNFMCYDCSMKNFLSGYKTYVGIGLTAIGVVAGWFDVTPVALPENWNEVLSTVGIIIATLGRLYTQGTNVFNKAYTSNR